MFRDCLQPNQSHVIHFVHTPSTNITIPSDPHTESHSTNDADKSAAVDPTHINTSITNTTTSSPSREVSPKYVVAGKKYGRRSRPASGAFEDMSSDSDSEANGTTAARSHHAAAPRQYHHQHDQQRSAAQNAAAQKATQKVMNAPMCILCKCLSCVVAMHSDVSRSVNPPENTRTCRGIRHVRVCLQ